MLRTERSLSRFARAGLALAVLIAGRGTAPAAEGFVPLFNGRDLAGWKVPVGDNGHWKVVGGVIDYDASSEAKGEERSLWSERELGDFVLRAEWRIKETPYINPNVPIVLPDGSEKKGVTINCLL